VGGSCISLFIFALLCSMPHYVYVNVLMGIFRGVYNGLKGTVSGVVFANFYGRRHVGAISSFERVFAITGAALGPTVFAFAREATGEFVTVLRVLALPPLLIGAAITVFLKQPKPQTAPLDEMGASALKPLVRNDDE
jgi:sugar phosphate permease